MGLLSILRQERYRKRLTPLPFFFTFSNAGLGFFAIIQSLEGHYTAAVFSIIAAALMDVFDGRLARALGATSMLGVELDSLADGISFCLAPAVLMYTAYPGSVELLHMIVLLLYVCAGLYRLARFNVYAATARNLGGLPTPIAALFVVSLILHQEWFMQSQRYFLGMDSLPFILTACIALLMISKVPFKKHSVFTHAELIRLVVVCGSGLVIFCEHGQPWLLMGVSLYIGYSLVMYIKLRIREMGIL